MVVVVLQSQVVVVVHSTWIPALPEPHWVKVHSPSVVPQWVGYWHSQLIEVGSGGMVYSAEQRQSSVVVVVVVLGLGVVVLVDVVVVWVQSSVSSVQYSPLADQTHLQLPAQGIAVVVVVWAAWAVCSPVVGAS